MLWLVKVIGFVPLPQIVSTVDVAHNDRLALAVVKSAFSHRTLF